ncbi:MAG: MMPL family transporter, partial [Gaiellaceae bacterium]
MERWTRTMVRYRWAVVAAWIAVFVASGAAASGLGDMLTNRFVLPGSESEKTAELLEEHFGRKPEGSFSLVAQGAPGSAQKLVAPLRQAARRAAEVLPTARVAAVQPVSDRVASATIVSELQPADSKQYTDDMRAAAGTIEGARLYVTGQSAIEFDLQPVEARDLKVAELYIAIPLALLILVYVFGSLAFLIPFALAAVSIPTTLGVIWIFAHFMTLSTYLTNLVALIGLG